jgi:hypothetical protein
MVKGFAWSSQDCAKPRTSAQHYSCSPRQYWTQNDLRHKVTHRTPILVAEHESQHSMVHLYLPPLPTSTNAKSPHSPDHRHSCPSIRQSLHQHNAHARFRWISLYRPRAMLPHLLPRISQTMFRICNYPRRLDLQRYHLSLGLPVRNCNQQQ